MRGEFHSFKISSVAEWKKRAHSPPFVKILILSCLKHFPPSNRGIYSDFYLFQYYIILDGNQERRRLSVEHRAWGGRQLGHKGMFQPTICQMVCGCSRQEELLEPAAQALLPAVPGDEGLGRISCLAGIAEEEPPSATPRPLKLVQKDNSSWDLPTAPMRGRQKWSCSFRHQA